MQGMNRAAKAGIIALTLLVFGGGVGLVTLRLRDRIRAEVLERARAALGLRVRLMPYLYTAAWPATEHGWPLARPLFWPDGADPALWDVDDAFLLGDHLLVAPVIAEGATERTVRLPAGEPASSDLR